MNDLTAFQNAGLPSDINAMKAALQKSQQEAPTLAGGIQYMTMNQEGKPGEGTITYGAERTEIEEGSEWVLLPQTLKHGYLARNGAKVDDEVWASVFHDLPDVTDKPIKRGFNWDQAYKGEFVCVSGEDVGTQVEFGGAAAGIVKMYSQQILPALLSQLDVDPGSLFLAVTFDVRSYDNKTYNKTIYEPVVTPVSWFSEAELAELGVEGKKADAAPEEPEEAADDVIEGESEEVSGDGEPEEKPKRQRRQRRAAK